MCGLLPHSKDCPAAPFFLEEDALVLDEAEEQAPFILICPRGHRFLQNQHILTYDYSPTEGTTEQMDLPLVCPLCGFSDKQSLPVIVGFNPFLKVDDPILTEHFKISCPALDCGWIGDRTDGAMDIWLEKAVVKGCVSMYYKAHNREYLKGEVYAEYTDLSITCPDCGHSCGEDAE